MPVCPLSREFLKASHFSLGPDPRLHDGTMQCTTHKDFPAYSYVTPVRPPSSPPQPSFFQRDDQWATQKRVSEVRRAFSPPPMLLSRDELRERRLEYTRVMQMSNLHLHADTRPVLNLSVARSDYGWPELPPSAHEDIRSARLLFDRDSMPSGDRKQLRIPTTSYQAHYPPYDDVTPQPHAPCSHLGGPNTLKWNYKGQEGTTYRKQFQAFPSPPALMCKRAFSSINLGDSKLGYSTLCSHVKETYTPQGLSPSRYDKAQAAAHIHQVNIGPGDRMFHCRTTTNDEFYSKEPETFVLQRDKTPESHIMKGNWSPGPGSLVTSTKFFHGEPPPLTQPQGRHMPHEKLKDHLALGEPKLLGNFFQTSMGSDYTFVTNPIRQRPLNLSLLESNLPEGTGELDFLTTNQKMIKPHGIVRASATEELLRKCRGFGHHNLELNQLGLADDDLVSSEAQCKYSHIEPPLGRQRFFSTHYQKEFPFKYQGPLVQKPSTMFESHLPLGTARHFGCWHEKVDLRVPQTPMYPCRSQE